MRGLSLYLPDWSVDLTWRRAQAKRAQDHPPPRGPRPAIVLITESGQRQMVAHGCRLARKAGIYPQMTLAHARALLPPDRLYVAPHQPEQDAASLVALASWATRFSPLVEVDPPDGLLLDIHGCSRVFGGTRRLLEEMVAQVTELGFRCRAAVAPTLGAAWAAARFSRSRKLIVPPSRLREFLGGLPLRALRADQAVEDDFAAVGITRIRQLMDLPRQTLPVRFGDELLQRLDQALGDAPEPLGTFPWRPAPLASYELDGPSTQLEAIEALARQLLGELAEQLAKVEAGVTRLELTLYRVNQEPAPLSLELAHPSRDPRHLWKLLAPRLERIDLGFGVERMEIHARRTALLAHEQRHLSSTAPRETGPQDVPGHPNPAALCHAEDPEDTEQTAAAALIDVLVNRLGREHVLRPRLLSTHEPEAAESLAMASEVWASRTSTSMRRPDPQPAAHEPSLPDRPTRLWDPPEPIAPPHPDSVVAGPERIAPAWWSGRFPGARAGTRDYYRIFDQNGRCLWIFQHLESGRWYRHGMWM